MQRRPVLGNSVLTLLLQPWDSQIMEKRFFIITRKQTKSGRKSIDKGTEAEHGYSQSRSFAYPVFNAGEILQVSLVDRPKPTFKADEHKGAQKQRDLGRKNCDSNAVPQRRQAPERPGPPAALSPTAAVENGGLKRVVSGGSLGSALQTAPLELGSLTELQASNGATVHGVVRWIGVPEGKSENWAGVELDYELKDCLDGQLGGQRYFNCDRNKGMFVKLRDLRPDSRFLPAPSYKEPPCYPEAAERRFEADSRNEDAPPIPESSALQLLEGRMKGIQGHYNSCYLDSALFSLFSFSPALDSVLHCPVVSEELIQSVLRRDIVNRLRRQGFVPAENVMKLRQLLGCDSFTFEEKDPEEFLSVLLHQVLSVDPLLKIRSNEKTQDCYSYQIILEREEAVSVPSVQLLLERSFLSCDLKFEEIPSCLIIQMPRFGKKFKMFPKIIPSAELDITDLLYNTPRECFLCGAVAELECYQCLRDPRLMPGMIKQFCRPCDKQTLQKLVYNPDRGVVAPLTANWVHTWKHVIDELRSGVSLRKSEEHQNTSSFLQVDLSPHEKLMNDIRYRQYTLRKVQTVDNLQRLSSPHDVVLNFVRSNPRLKPEDCKSFESSDLMHSAELPSSCTDVKFFPMLSSSPQDLQNGVSDQRRRSKSFDSSFGLNKKDFHDDCQPPTIADVMKLRQAECRQYSGYGSSRNRRMLLPYKWCVHLPVSFFKKLVLMKDGDPICQTQETSTFWQERWDWDCSRIPLVLESRKPCKTAPQHRSAMQDWYSNDICVGCQELLVEIDSGSRTNGEHKVQIRCDMEARAEGDSMLLPYKWCVHLPVSFFKKLVLMKDGDPICQTQETSTFWQERWDWDCSRIPLVLESRKPCKTAPQHRSAMQDWYSNDICVGCQELLVEDIKPKKKTKDKRGAAADGKKRVKKEPEEKWKWWEEERYTDGVKWKFLEHKGPVFAPDYEPLPSKVKFYYDGKPMKLSPQAEEVATFFAKMLDHEYTTKDIFRKNFFKDWRKEMTSEEKSVLTDLKKCDFTEMSEYFKAQSEARKQMTKEEKLKVKEENERLLQAYGFCVMDNHKERIANFRIEPPGLFRGRGDHPKMGMLKRRIQPEEIIINCSKDSKIPLAPAGHKWKEVRHDNKVTWLVSWNENIQGSIKYIMLNPSSRIKGEKDWQKYETARKLKKCVDRIRNQYREDWKSKEMKIRQRAVALYFIDKLALRAGNEKEEGESADTVGCCSLRVEHIKLYPEMDGQEFVVEFDFLGKDSIRYYNKVPVEKRVFKNLQLFMENKQPEDDLFDRLNTSILNKHLQELMDGLTAKVFRTYNASITLQQQLKELTNPDENLPAKILSYNRANRAVAVLCNHQRAPPKTFEKSMQNLQTKIDSKKDQISASRRELKSAKADAKVRRDEKTKKCVESKKKAVQRLEEQLMKLEVQATDREENKQIALGTSKLNYLDPRISVAWCKKWDVPIEKIYNKTQREKFAWAIDMAEEDYEF
ncbi:UNVERIFIED_CONTAM: hypothetical protein FKN15_077171 [Acipenser sinensis]